MKFLLKQFDLYVQQGQQGIAGILMGKLKWRSCVLKNYDFMDG